MVKSSEAVREKMKDRITTGGKYLKIGMEEAEDPIKVLLEDPETFAKKLIDGVKAAMERKAYQAGLKTAQERDAWRNAIDRASAHFEERADEIVDRAMESYNARSECIEKAKKAVAGMPSATRTQRIEKSKRYQEIVGECFDKVFGRK